MPCKAWLAAGRCTQYTVRSPAAHLHQGVVYDDGAARDYEIVIHELHHTIAPQASVTLCNGQSTGKGDAKAAHPEGLQHQLLEQGVLDEELCA